VNRTPRGRVVMPLAFQHLGLGVPKNIAREQSTLFGEEPL
jgi:hypothetical protein